MARIALILPRLSRYGGVEQFAFRLAEALAETRNSEHEVEFICARSECLPPVGVRTHIVGRPGGLKFIKMLWFLIRAEQVRKRRAPRSRAKMEESCGAGRFVEQRPCRKRTARTRSQAARPEWQRDRPACVHWRAFSYSTDSPATKNAVVFTVEACS